MSDPLRTDPHRSPEAAGGQHDARIEDLLLSGLDHYFAAEYQQAIDIWTRVLFFDRNHPRARAYIERARSALAERMRESDELLHSGVAAFNRGETDAARRLLDSAVERGGPHEVALALLARLNRLEAATTPIESSKPGRPPRSRTVRAPAAGMTPARRTRWIRVVVVSAMAVATLAAAASWQSLGLLELLDLARSEAWVAPAVARPEDPLPLPRPAEAALGKARALFAEGRLHDSLRALDSIRLADALSAEADRLRAEIQRALLARPPGGNAGGSASAPPQPPQRPEPPKRPE